MNIPLPPEVKELIKNSQAMMETVPDMMTELTSSLKEILEVLHEISDKLVES